MRPLEVQRREEAKNRRGGGILFQGGDGREEAMARRSKTIPKEEPKKKRAQEHYIGEQGVKRKREATSLRREDGPRPRPNPARGNLKLIGGKRKATGPPDPENPEARRKPPPKPEGRQKSSNRKDNTKKMK